MLGSVPTPGVPAPGRVLGSVLMPGREPGVRPGVAGRVPAVGNWTEPGRLPGVRPGEGRVAGRAPVDGSEGRAAGREATLGGRLIDGERPIEGEGRAIPPPPMRAPPPPPNPPPPPPRPPPPPPRP
ncbi:MAG TPA: hypothetical protein VFV87_06230 [Pirellulaceae bacterium]|nr:hypothetical protein [Pirellulaceae bacterium]